MIRWAGVAFCCLALMFGAKGRRIVVEYDFRGQNVVEELYCGDLDNALDDVAFEITNFARNLPKVDQNSAKNIIRWFPDSILAYIALLQFPPSKYSTISPKSSKLSSLNNLGRRYNDNSISGCVGLVVGLELADIWNIGAQEVLKEVEWKMDAMERLGECLARFPRAARFLESVLEFLGGDGDVYSARLCESLVDHASLGPVCMRRMARDEPDMAANRASLVAMDQLSRVSLELDWNPVKLNSLILMAESAREVVLWKDLDVLEGDIARRTRSVARWLMCAVAREGQRVEDCMGEVLGPVVGACTSPSWRVDGTAQEFGSVWNVGGAVLMRRPPISECLTSSKLAQFFPDPKDPIPYIVTQLEVLRLIETNHIPAWGVSSTIGASYLEPNPDTGARNRIEPSSVRRDRSPLRVVVPSFDYRCHPMGHMMHSVFAGLRQSNVRPIAAFYGTPFVPGASVVEEGPLDEEIRLTYPNRSFWNWELEKGAELGLRIGEDVLDGSRSVRPKDVGIVCGLAPLPSVGKRSKAEVSHPFLSVEEIQVWKSLHCKQFASRDITSSSSHLPPIPDVAPLVSKQLPTRQWQRARRREVLHPGLTATHRIGRVAERMIHIPETSREMSSQADNCGPGPLIGSLGAPLPIRHTVQDLEAAKYLDRTVLHPWEVAYPCSRLLDTSTVNFPVPTDQATTLLRHALWDQGPADVMMDVMGWTTSVWTSLLRNRPAPIVVTYLGWPGSLHTAVADYVVADKVLAEPETQFQHALWSQSGYESIVQPNTSWTQDLFHWTNDQHQSSLVGRCRNGVRLHPPEPRRTGSLPPRPNTPHPQNKFSEGILLLPRTYQSSRPPSGAVVPSRSQRTRHGLDPNRTVLAVIGRTGRLHPRQIHVWAQIARRTNAILWILGAPIRAHANLRREFAARGVLAVVFARKVSRLQHVERLALADLLLDTIVYNAHSTMAEALWMGTPVVTLVGSMFPGRVGASLLDASQSEPPLSSLAGCQTDSPSILAVTAHTRLAISNSLRSYTTTGARIAKHPRTKNLLRDHLFRGSLHAPLHAGEEGTPLDLARGLHAVVDVRETQLGRTWNACDRKPKEMLVPGASSTIRGWHPWHVAVRKSPAVDRVVSETFLAAALADGRARALDGSAEPETSVLGLLRPLDQESCAWTVLKAHANGPRAVLQAASQAISACTHAPLPLRSDVHAQGVLNRITSSTSSSPFLQAIIAHIRAAIFIAKQRNKLHRAALSVSRTATSLVLANLSTWSDTPINHTLESEILRSRFPDAAGQSIHPQPYTTTNQILEGAHPLLTTSFQIPPSHTCFCTTPYDTCLSLLNNLTDARQLLSTSIQSLLLSTPNTKHPLSTHSIDHLIQTVLSATNSPHLELLLNLPAFTSSLPPSLSLHALLSHLQTTVTHLSQRDHTILSSTCSCLQNCEPPP